MNSDQPDNSGGGEILPDPRMKMRRSNALMMNRILGVIIVILTAILIALFLATILVPAVVEIAEQKAAQEKAEIWVPKDWVGTLQSNASSPSYLDKTTGGSKDNSIVDTQVYNPYEPDSSFEQKIVKKEGKYMLVIYEDRILYPQNALERSSSLVLSDVHPVTTLTLEYFVPDVTVHKSVKTGSHFEEGKYFDDYNEFDVTYPNPDARLTVRVYAEDGSLYREEGYGGMFDIGTKDVIKFMNPGDYSVEILGKDIEFAVSVAIW